MVWSQNHATSVTAGGVAKIGQPSDQEVMADLRANDEQALDLLFERYSRLVFGIAFRILHDHGEAEEVVQEAFIALFQRSKLFDPSKGTAKAWIAQIAFNRALDRKSYLKRRGFYFEADVECLNNLVAETDLDREISAKLNRVQLEKAFEELPEMQRRTLELFYFEGLELREVSEELNEPIGNVRHHFYRGLERLRKSAFVQRLGKR
jgi:RNA polymerase sigma-70 factor (ECF subfamily)